MRLLSPCFAAIVLCLAACVSSPLPLQGGQVQRDRACQWQHLELHLVLDHVHEHLLGTARLHIRSLDTQTREVRLDVGALRLSGAAVDSAGRELERIESRGTQRVYRLAAPLVRGEEEVLEVRFDGVAGAGLRFFPAEEGGWVLFEGGGFFPHVGGRGHFPTMDVTLFANGERIVVGPGRRLLEGGTSLGPVPAHFRIADPMDPGGVNFLVGGLEPVVLSGEDEGWSGAGDGPIVQLWSQAWMQARATDALPGAPCRVVFLPQELGLSGWQGGWVAVPLDPSPDFGVARVQCRRWVIEQNLIRGMLPDSEQGRAWLAALVWHAQAGEGVAPGVESSRMSRGIEAMEGQLGAAAFEGLRNDFLDAYRGQPFGVWEWARFAEHRVGFSAQALFETLTGR